MFKKKNNIHHLCLRNIAFVMLSCYEEIRKGNLNNLFWQRKECHMKKQQTISILAWGLAVLLSGCSDNTATTTISPVPSVQPSQSSENEESEIIEGVLDLDNKIYTIQYQEDFDKGNGETINFSLTIVFALNLEKQPLNESGYYISVAEPLDINYSPENYQFILDDSCTTLQVYEQNHQIVKFPVEFKIIQTDHALNPEGRESIQKFNVVIDLLELTKE